MPASPSAARSKAFRSASPDGAGGAIDANTNKAVTTILKSRKCWRNMKGKEEAVWPPELETALIEGLERYRPAEAKSSRLLGRFPMRNKFVADHIFETTGYRRTPKQVGSRIQQLRDTSSGKHILKEISDRHYEMMHPNRPKVEEPTDSQASSSTQPCRATLIPPPITVPAMSHVYINTLSPGAAWLAGAPSMPLAGIGSQEARPLHAFDPTVSFTSPGQVPCQSVYQVYKDGVIIHQECAPVAISSSALPGPSTSTPMFVYSTTLVPQYWPYLVDVEDLSNYTIYQQVIQVPLSAVASPVAPVIFSVLYHFLNASMCQLSLSPPPLSPRSSCGESEVEYSSLSSESSPSPQLDNTTLTSLDHAGIPELLFNFEDDYSSLPASPLHFPTMDMQPWSYAPSNLCPSPDQSPASACDPYLDAAALFDAFVYQ